MTAPTLVVAGDQEQFVDITHTVKLFQLLKRGELCIIPNADHRVFARRPDLFNEVALEFLLREAREDCIQAAMPHRSRLVGGLVICGSRTGVVRGFPEIR